MESYYPLLIDIILLAVIVISALSGRHRGLIKTLSWIITLFLAFTLSGFLANKTTPLLAKQFIYPKIEEVITVRTEDFTTVEIPTKRQDLKDLLSDVDIPEKYIDSVLSHLPEKFSDVTDTRETSKKAFEAAVTDLSELIIHPILCIIYFILLCIIISFLLKFINILSKIPGINSVNKFLGFVFGLLLGLIIVSIIVRILHSFNYILTNELIGKTRLLKQLFAVLSI